MINQYVTEETSLIVAKYCLHYEARIELLQHQLKQLDKGWNKSIDAHEVTKQRLLKYENEAGVPHAK